MIDTSLKSARFGLLSVLIGLLAVANSFIIASYFSYSGYWDDTILFVRLIDEAPSNPFRAMPWILNQPGDLNGPLPLLILYFLDFTGLLSNYSLILLCNFALVALFAILIYIAVRLGAPIGLTLLSAALLYFSPVLVEQRTWFIAIQHTLTVLFSAAACYLTYRIVMAQKPTRGKLTLQLACLDLVLVGVALGRETGLVLALTAIGALSFTRCQHHVTVALGWTLPILIQIHRFLSGREGTHVQRVFWGFGVEVPSAWGTIGMNITPTQILITCVVVVAIAQAVIFLRSGSPEYLPSLVDTRKSRNAAAKTTPLICGVWLVLAQFPAAGVPLTALLPPFSAAGAEKLVFGRWSQFGFDAGVYQLALVVTLGTAFFVSSQTVSALLAFTVLCTAPYLAVGSGIISVVTERPTDTLARYAIYFVPAVFFLLNEFIRKLHTSRTQLFGRSRPLLLVFLLIWCTPQALSLNQLLRQRSSDFTSFTVESCDSRSYMVLSEITGGFVTNEYAPILVKDPALALFNDAVLKSRFPNLGSQVVTQSDILQYCFDELSVEALVDRLGMFASGETQVQIDAARAAISLEDEVVVRSELRTILETLIDDNVIQPAP